MVWLRTMQHSFNKCLVFCGVSDKIKYSAPKVIKYKYIRRWWRQWERFGRNEVENIEIGGKRHEKNAFSNCVCASRKNKIKREKNQIKSVEEPKSVVWAQPQHRSSRATVKKIVLCIRCKLISFIISHQFHSTLCVRLGSHCIGIFFFRF